MSVEVLSLWSTPVARVPLSLPVGLLEGWRDTLVASSEVVPSWRVSNAGGAWHSAPDLASQGAFRPVGEAIVAAVMEVFASLAAPRGGHPAVDARLTAWGMVTPRGGYVMPHDHAQRSDFSVVLPLDVGDADHEVHPQSGKLVLHDPRGVPSQVGGVELHPPQLTREHQVGTLIVFPGWVQHWVHPYRGERPRVVVSANVELVVRRPSPA